MKKRTMVKCCDLFLYCSFLFVIFSLSNNLSIEKGLYIFIKLYKINKIKGYTK